MSKEDKPCHWNIIKVTDKGGLGLRGVTGYDKAFLDEFDISKLGNTDAALNALKNACHSFKFPHRVVLQDKDLTKIKVLYEFKHEK